MNFRHPIVCIVLFLLCICAPALKAQNGLDGALSRGATTIHALSGFSQQLVAADFDNDQKPDGAILEETGFLNGRRAFRIELYLTSGNNNAITFSSADSGLAISTIDVNEDGVPDIVVESAYTRQRVQVYLNDGHGAFHEASAEDYPSPDPSAPAWRTTPTMAPPAFGLPVSRSSDPGDLRQVSILHRDPSEKVKYRTEGPLVQSAALAPSASRAPPLLSL